MSENMKTVIISHSHPLIKAGGGEVCAYRQFKTFKKEARNTTFVGILPDQNVSQRLLGPHKFSRQIHDGDFVVRGEHMETVFLDHRNTDQEEQFLNFLLDLEADIYHFHHVWKIGVSLIHRLRSHRPDAKFVCTLHEMLLICVNHGQMVKSNAGQLCHGADPVSCSICVPTVSALTSQLRRDRMLGVLACFDVLISPSNFLASRFEDWGVEKGRIHVIENGLPFAQSDSCLNGHSPIDLKNLANRFAFFGQATLFKGLNVLLEAANVLDQEINSKDLIFDIHGATAEDVERFWPDLKLSNRVKFHGAYQADDVIDLMSKYGWIIMPSIWWENSPVVIQEAQAARRPMIASNIGGMLEKTKSWGTHFEVGDAHSLANVIKTKVGNASALEAEIAKVPNPFSIDEYIAAWKDIVCT